jgi:hypothetical protein
MIYLTWGILNIAMFLFFIITCFRAIGLVKQKLGLLTAVVFIIGLMSLSGTANSSKDWHKQAFNNRDTTDQNSGGMLHIDLERTWISKYTLGVNYALGKESKQAVVLEAYSSTNGWSSGTDWEPGYISIRPTADGQKLQYEVWGNVRWTLLGLTVYRKAKRYKGEFSIR